MSEVVGKTCPYCQFPVKPGEQSVVCSACGLAHHARCWEENGKCTTYSCNGQPAVAGALPPPLPPGGSMDFAAGISGCQRCGADNLADANFCKGCGATLAPMPHRGWAAGGEPGPAKQLSSYPRAARFSRLIAWIIDSLISSCVSWMGKLVVGFSPGLATAFSVVGGIWSLYYSFTKDGWAGGRSVGKRAMGLRVVHLATNRPCTKMQSVVRQIVFILGIAPITLGAFSIGLGSPAGKTFGTVALGVGAILGIIICLIEGCLALFSATGRRMGDRMAGTQVVAYKDYRPD